jgi:Xaa-Pro aminopeptidase
LGRPCIRTEGGTLKWAQEVISKIGNLAEGKIGVDILTPNLIKWMEKGFPKAEFVDAKPIITKAKAVKTLDELECQRAVTVITEAGFHALLEKLKPGVKECELLAAAWQKFTELGSEWSQCSNIVASGPYTAPYRRFTSDRIVREGDLVIVDIGAGFNGYWGDFTRTYVCGDMMPTKEQIELHQECYDTLFAACNEVRVGNKNTDVDKWLNHPKLNPNSFGMSSGHGAGVNPWEQPWVVNVTDADTVPFEVGNYMSIEPYAGIVGIGGIRLENQILVTEEGPDIFTTIPFDERLVKNVHPLDKTTGRKIRRG